MADPIGSLRGMTVELSSKFKGLGVKTSDDLLGKCATPTDRRDLAAQMGIDVKLVLEYANRADLARIKGVADIYADLLENAGVDTVRELARRVPENLHAKLAEVNATTKLTARLPTVDMVKDWVEQAKALPPALEY